MKRILGFLVCAVALLVLSGCWGTVPCVFDEDCWDVGWDYCDYDGYCADYYDPGWDETYYCDYSGCYSFLTVAPESASTDVIDSEEQDDIGCSADADCEDGFVCNENGLCQRE